MDLVFPNGSVGLDLISRKANGWQYRCHALAERTGENAHETDLRLCQSHQVLPVWRAAKETSWQVKLLLHGALIRKLVREDDGPARCNVVFACLFNVSLGLGR